ncbi:MAG: quinolinate synthase NadA [Campylobacterales bacterium]
MVERVQELKRRLGVTIAAHYYQKDEVFDLADLTGDSFQLAKEAQKVEGPLIFCGVKFMGESAKILNPELPVYMPKLSNCSMAEMGELELVKRDLAFFEKRGIGVLPILYINSSAQLKGLVGKLGGATCTSSSAEKLVRWGLEQRKRIYFLPDKNLGRNIAKKLGLVGRVVGEEGWEEADIICFNGHCSVHQLFKPEHIHFYRERYPGIKIVVHPECAPEVVELADFAGSTSQILKYVESHREELIAIGTEANFVNRLKRDLNPNIYLLSSTIPLCPSMNETRLQDLYTLLERLERGEDIRPVEVPEEVAEGARLALQRMIEVGSR